jgi:hypothetical protein
MANEVEGTVPKALYDEAMHNFRKYRKYCTLLEKHLREKKDTFVYEYREIADER